MLNKKLVLLALAVLPFAAVPPGATLNAQTTPHKSIWTDGVKTAQVGAPLKGYTPLKGSWSDDFSAEAPSRNSRGFTPQSV